VTQLEAFGFEVQPRIRSSPRVLSSLQQEKRKESRRYYDTISDALSIKVRAKRLSRVVREINEYTVSRHLFIPSWIMATSGETTAV
jgi:L-rhamnose isomerase